MQLARKAFLGLVATVVLLAGTAGGVQPGYAQSIYIGPGGVRIDDGHERWRSHRRRGSEGGAYHRRWESERADRARMCERLRRACINKEERGQTGEGNCRRYRRMCG